MTTAAALTLAALTTSTAVAVARPPRPRCPAMAGMGFEPAAPLAPLALDDGTARLTPRARIILAGPHPAARVWKGKRVAPLPRGRLTWRALVRRAGAVADYAAREWAGNQSAPGKMPCPGYSTPAQLCQVGSKLRAVPGSTCSGCYACKGQYLFRGSRWALAQRFSALRDLPRWVESLTVIIAVLASPSGCGYLPHLTPKQASNRAKRAELRPRRQLGLWRWHDSGDLQSVSHLRAIAMIAQNLQDVTFWLPTREFRIVRGYLAQYGAFPQNLVVRLSAHKVDGGAPAVNDGRGGRLPVSHVHTAAPAPGFIACHAVERGTGECGTCRACWNPRINVSYGLH